MGGMVRHRRVAVVSLLAAFVAVSCGDGGQQPASGPSRILEVLTPASGSQAARWDVKALMVTARTQAAGGAVGGSLYVIGGFDGSKSLSSVEAYDPAANMWTPKAPMPTARHGAGSAVVGGLLYVAGGINAAENRHLAGLEVYDPATNSWSIKRPMTVPRYQPRAVAIGSRLYVIGGCVGWCAPTTDAVEVYDTATDTWAKVRPQAFPRGSAVVASVDGRIVVAGGCCGNTQSETSLMGSRVEVYDPATDAWTTKNGHYVSDGGAAGTIDGRVYVAGSYPAEVYDPAADAWAPLPPMPTPRQYAVGGVIDGRFYVASGTAGSGPVAASPPTPPVVQSPPPLAVLLAGARDATFRVTFRVTVAGGPTAVAGTQTWYVRRGSSRFDFTLAQGSGAQGSASVYVIPEGTYLCTSAGGPTMCIAMPAAAALQGNPNAAFDLQLRERPDQYASTYQGTRQIAGQTAQCYSVAVPSAGTTRLCYTSAGIPLLIESAAAGITTTFEATELGTTVSDADLRLPAPPAKLPGAP